MLDKKIHVGIITALNLWTNTAPVNTALNIVNNLDPKHYTIDIFLIDHFVPKNLETTPQAYSVDQLEVPLTHLQHHTNVGSIRYIDEFTLTDLAHRMDVAIVTIYNTFGEDGKVLGLLETIGVPYLCPSAKASALCFDKQFTNAVLRDAGIAVPKEFVVYKTAKDMNIIESNIMHSFGFPVIVKTAASGASYGVFLIHKPSELSQAIDHALEFSDEVLIQEYLRGEEYTVGVTGQYTNPTALPVVQIIPKNTFFDFRAKYTEGKAEELCPAPIALPFAKTLQDIAIHAYQVTKCTSQARIDMIVSKNIIYVLDINTFPGITSASIFPKELVASGSSLKEFLDARIQEVMKAHK